MKLNAGPGNALDRLLAEVRRAPGVRAVGITSSLPPNVSQMRTSLPVMDRTGAERELSFDIVAASGGVFEALGVPLLEGRSFGDGDTADATPVVILSKKASERFFPVGSAAGQVLHAFAANRAKGDPLVVGVVGDVKFAGLEAPPDGAIYLPFTQRSFPTQYLVVRSSVGAADPAAVRGIVRAVEPGLALSEVRSARDLVGAATARPRFQASVLLLLAALAISLAVVGLYGVITHVVGQRTPELALRMALGATRHEVLRMILSKAIGLSVLGVGLGLGLSFASVRLIAGFLYGVEPFDWPSFVAAAGFAIALALFAACGPALRATRVDPAAVLRA
jgi:hypothetical protein